MTIFGLDRFVAAQEHVYDRALAELKQGRKQGHWMWFVFPQIAGLGRSPTALFYAIASAEGARAYLAYAPLGARLIECTGAMLANRDRSAEAILGPVDATKLRSSMTLFDAVAGPGAPFAEALNAFYAGRRDEATLELLSA
jgi:uncharacterized protein (DUF1810 family)